jgi:nucleoside-diphosphate-sugar epimerase
MLPFLSRIWQAFIFVYKNVTGMHIILGAGGIIADSLARELVAAKENVVLVSRRAKSMEGATVRSADISDLQQTLDTVQQDSIVYLCVGLKYDFRIWKEQWPKIMDNVLEACKRKNARLIFFDNVYMYGKVDGPMTEDTPYDPDSRKGDLRARIATRLMSEVRKGNINALIARSADFYGPGAERTSIPNMLVFANLAKGRKAQWLVNAHRKHSFTFTPDASRALYLLAKNEESWNQVWHLPTAAPPLTGQEFIQLAASAMGRPAKYTVLGKWLIGVGGMFDRTIRELYEMAYQNEFDYLFDSSKFNAAFHFEPTSYQEGIMATAKSFTAR